jgi:tRNA (guanine10-N2)-dimethyltransferase
VRAFIELSGEHPTLPRAEALAAIAAERLDLRSASFAGPLLRIDAIGPIERVARRIGLAHTVCEELVSGDFEAIRAFAQDMDLAGRTFRVRARGLGTDIDPSSLEGPLGAVLGQTGRVDLDFPADDFRLLVADEFVLGRVIHRVDRSRLESTKVAHRAFSLPISLHPKFARALVNLSRVPMAGTVLDPFCGTGGVVLEAAAMGLRPIGSDRDRAMVSGTRAALRGGSSDGYVAVADAGRLPLRPGTVHGIATDPPYGRASSTKGERIRSLYERAFRAFADLLPQGVHAAVVLPDPSMTNEAPDSFEFVEAHALRVHRSLVRHFCVFVRV